jgi:hypothetical protein
MWNLKVSIVNGKEKQLYNSLLYNSFRRALSDTLDGIPDIYDCVPFEDCCPQFICPTHMMFHSTDKESEPDDLEIRYQLGVDKYLVVYIGKACAFDND